MNRKIQSLSLIIGSLLSVVIVCAQLFHFQAGTSPSKKDVKTEHQENNQPDTDVLLSFSSFSLPTSVQLSVNLDACFLFEILFEQKQENEPSEEAPSYPERFFITLFRVIISPNAP